MWMRRRFSSASWTRPVPTWRRWCTTRCSSSTSPKAFARGSPAPSTEPFRSRHPKLLSTTCEWNQTPARPSLRSGLTTSCSARAERTARAYGGSRSNENVAAPCALCSGDRRRDGDHGGDLADQLADLRTRPVRHLPAPGPVAGRPLGKRPRRRRKRWRFPLLRLLLRSTREHLHGRRTRQLARADRPARSRPCHEPAGRGLPPLPGHRGSDDTRIACALRGGNRGASLAGGDRRALLALQASHTAYPREPV